MDETAAHFSVDPRLTRLLGETYRSSEAALKELVDNAWDADAQNVWIDLPSPLTGDPIRVRDDGVGMTPIELQHEYLNIASDKRRRTGDKSSIFNRRVKGRKGIGKFAGLTIASTMKVTASSRGQVCNLLIDKKELLAHNADLEAVPLSFSVGSDEKAEAGVLIELSDLDDRLNFPVAEKLREILIHEYGREDAFKVYVNGVALSVVDVPGVTSEVSETLPESGPVRLQYTVAEGKRPPRSPGIILKVDGKAVGKPMLFGLDEDESIPAKLVKRVYGEVEVSNLSDYVTADWGAVIENSKAFQEAKQFVQDTIKENLHETHTREMRAQQSRIQRQIDRRLAKLPEHRRKYAQQAVDRILRRYYDESDERVATIAEVALDAMEHDEYWIVFEKINDASRGQVSDFASSLEQFGLLDLSYIGSQTSRRLDFLNYFEQLAANEETLEQDIHKAFENSLWMLGRSFSTMASNTTLARIVDEYGSKKYHGERGRKRPDLLLSQDISGSYLIIEFKRPSHVISRDDVAQAEKYRDDLTAYLPSTSKIDILMLGKGRSPVLNTNNLAANIEINSYSGLIGAARNELEWLLRSLASG